jgi:hypothetical protein
MKKPDKWYQRKLTPEAKKYLSFKLKQYYKNKKEEAETRKIKPKQDENIRVWLKYAYTNNNKHLFIEAYIDGKKSDEYRLQDYLYNLIKTNFNKDIADMAEFGQEKISNSENVDTTPRIRYKHNLKGHWKYLR